MREFFKQCLEELEALTGNRQAYFFATDPDGTRKMTVCIDGMVLACNDYPFIPEQTKKKIIRDQMVKDQTYEALNSRTVHKWLTAASNAYRTHSQFSESGLIPKDENGQVTQPASPEVADKYLEEFKANLANIGRPVPPVLPEGETRKDPHLRGAVATMRPSAPAEDVRRWELHNEYLRTNYHHITGAKLPGWMSEEEWTKLQTI